MTSIATIKTSKGEIKVELNDEAAPISTENFKQYAKDGFYAGTIFHRVIPGFMIQGGGMNAEMEDLETRAPIKNESDNGLSNQKYSLAMARTNVPDSATSQFFINASDNGFLNKNESQDGVGYAVFGQVIDGQDVVDAIEQVETTTKSPHGDVPIEPIEIISVELE